MSNICIYFVLFDKYKDENEAPENMVQAFDMSKPYVENVSWIKERDLNALTLRKTDVIVFEEFTGESFHKLKQTKYTILGPMALLICLTEGKEIPKFTFPIYNVAMYNMIVACSLLPKKVKMEIKEKVQLMGGCYTDSLMDKNTHLIVGSTKTEKYLTAAEKGLKLMLPAWVDAVWSESQTSNVRGSDEKFKKYRCLPFHNLTICCTGITSLSKRKELSELIKNNGGIMNAQLNLITTDVLICHGELGCSSEKFKAAQKQSEISCVSIEWLYDSIQKGYALKPDSYQIKKSTTSTPTKDISSLNPNFSNNISTITINNTPQTVVNETILPTTSQQRGKKRKSDNIEYIDKIDIKRVKKAGQFLDGCSVYLAGFDADHRDKLIKILNVCGATRYDAISDRLTHVIFGDISCQEFKVIKSKNLSCCHVKLQWLLDCIEAERIVGEEQYLVEEMTSEVVKNNSDKIGSPLCKRGLNLLNNKTITENEFEEHQKLSQSVQNVEEDDVLKIYARPVNTSPTLAAQLLNNIENKDPIEKPSVSQISSSSQNSTIKNIFAGQKFMLVNFSEEETHSLKLQIEAEAGEVVPKNFKGIPDYVVTPTFPKNEILQTGTEIVNDIWINECVSECLKVDIQYYHKPFVLNNSEPLKKCVVTISGYSGFERIFLKQLISKLGAVSQEQFARITSEEKNIFASTHLLSPEASGKKYLAAIKWKLPIVSKFWLLECAKTNKYVSEKEFLIGDSIVPQKSEEKECKNETPKKHFPWDPKTPEIPNFGSTSKGTPNIRKEGESFLNSISELNHTKKKQSTPLAVLKEKVRHKLYSQNDEYNLDHSILNKNVEKQQDTKPDENSTQNLLLNDKLEQLENMLTTSNGPKRCSRNFQSIVPAPASEVASKDSQVFTVGWDFTSHNIEDESSEAPQKQIKIFMISGIDQKIRENLTAQIESLGGTVNDSPIYDPSCTHLLCLWPGRNEKVLSCMAAGKWILHYSYIEDCVKNGEFLDEEQYEFGNPKSQGKFELKEKNMQKRLECMHYWRKEISDRGYGAFHNMRAILIAKHRGPIIRVIEAGGGVVIDVSPPFDDTVHATHCLIESSSLKDPTLYIPLARQGVYCLNTLYISDCLHRTAKSVKECVLPVFAKFYG